MSRTCEMNGLVRPEAATAWELRARWAQREPVVVTLTDRCLVRRIEGRVSYVSVTGAFAVIDGWHVPTIDVLAILRPHHSQRESDAVAA